MSTVTETVVEVGTIFDSSWGYDQTNIDFYEVVSVAKSGKSVMLQEIGQHVDGTAGSGCDYVTPNRAIKKGEPFRRKLHIGSRGDVVGVSISSYQWASLWTGDRRYQTAAGWGH